MYSGGTGLQLTSTVFVPRLTTDISVGGRSGTSKDKIYVTVKYARIFKQTKWANSGKETIFELNVLFGFKEKLYSAYGKMMIVFFVEYRNYRTYK